MNRDEKCDQSIEQRFFSRTSDSMNELFKLLSKVVITFLLTNIQDVVILMNFFLQSSKEQSVLKNDHVVLGQFLGFSTLLMLSLIGYTISYILPVKLFGFLGFLIIFFGLNGLYDLIKHLRQERKEKAQKIVEKHEQIETIQLDLVKAYSYK